MPVYASTDPNFGLGDQPALPADSKYASTDPNFGLTPDTPPAMTPEDMSRTGQTQFEPSAVTAGTEPPNKLAEALRANIQPILDHPVDSFTGMFTNWDDVKHLYQQPQDILGPNVKRAVGLPVRPDEEIGSQQWWNTGVGAALAAGAFRGGPEARPEPSMTDQIRQSLAPEAPVNAQEAPPARPEQVQATTTPETTQSVDKASSLPENQSLGSVSRVSVPTVDDLKVAVSEGRLDDAKDIALQMERAAKQPAPVDVAQETPTFRPQDEPRPTDQAVGESAGQQQPAPERAAGVDTGQQGNLGQAGQRTEGAPAGTSNRQNVETYGAGEVPSGTGVDTGELLDNARAAIRSGTTDPNSILSRTRANGIANPQEYATLAAEHERLVNDAVAKEKAGDPTAPQAAQYAKDFANAIQPHKTAASDLFRLFQGDLNYDLGTQFGMNEYMKAEIGRPMKPSEAPKFNRMSSDIRGAESEVPKAVERSDARVRTKYANVADIPMKDAADRVRQFLKDCQV